MAREHYNAGQAEDRRELGAEDTTSISLPPQSDAASV